VASTTGNRIAVDAPIFNHFDKSLSQSFIYKYNRAGLVTEAGIEDLRIEIAYDSNSDDAHAEDGVVFNKAENSWAKNVAVLYFNKAGIKTTNSTLITVINCQALRPRGTNDGGYRYNFDADDASNNILFTGCSTNYGRHDYVANGAASASGIVFTNSTSDQTNDTSEGHRKWSQGLLYDKLTYTNVGSATRYTNAKSRYL